MAAPTLKVDGTITRIIPLETRKGHRFLRVHVTSPAKSIDVDIFDRKHQEKLYGAKPGDKLRAIGTGFHRGPIRNGKTSLTARSILYTKDAEGRAQLTRPKQLSLFPA